MGDWGMTGGNRSAAVAFGFGQQGRGSDSKGFGNAGQTQNGDVALGTFDHADVGPVQVGLSGEGLLAYSNLLSGRPDGSSQGDGKGGVRTKGQLRGYVWYV